MGTSWRIHGQVHDLSVRGWIMGVLNVTPDSFSDGGCFFRASQALEHGLRLVEEGADVLDIGGESTRPGADPVSTAEELRRVLPVIEGLRCRTQAILSIDTMKAEVAREAIAAGADIVNDVNGLRDPRMIETIAATSAGVVVMHMQGTPRTMQAHPVYADVVGEVRAFFEERVGTLAAAGVCPSRVALDPGFGFGKTLSHNTTLLKNLGAVRVRGLPLVVGVSRKSMLGTLLENPDMEKRRWPTVALTSWLRESGAEVVRVHDVKPNSHAMRMTEAILHG